MNNQNRMVVYTATKVFKTVFKGAFAAGMGFTIGKTFGVFCTAILDEGVYKSVLKFLAEKGNKHAQNICNETKIKYASKQPDVSSETSNKIGFTVNN